MEVGLEKVEELTGDEVVKKKTKTGGEEINPFERFFYKRRA